MNIDALFSIKTVPSEIADSACKQRENNIFHTPYKAEIRLFSCIQQGDCDKLFDEFTALIGEGIFVGQMSDNDLRQNKYMAVSCITLATRYAIQGGLDESAAYRFSDVFIREVDMLNTPEAVIAYLAKSITELTQTVADNAKKFRYSPHVRRCMTYIDKHLNQKIGVHELAEECGLSNDYLSHVFKKETGENVSSYILRQKLEAAKTLIFDGADSGKVCCTLGFCSQSHFISAFRKLYGLTPGEYALLVKQTKK